VELKEKHMSRKQKSLANLEELYPRKRTNVLLGYIKLSPS